MMLELQSIRRACARLCLILSFLLPAGLSGLIAQGGLPQAHAAFSPDSWTLTEYGNSTGSVSASGSTYTLQTNGYNVWGTEDEFTFVSRVEESPYDECSIVTITATIESISDYENVNASAGLMFRDSDTAGSKNVMWRVLPNGATRFTYRTADGGASGNISGPTLAFPMELKLVRQGSTFTAYYKQNGQWKLHRYVTVGMDADAMAGIGGFSVTSNPIAAVFSHVDVVGVNNYTPMEGGYTDTEPVPGDLLLRDRFEDGSGTNVPETVANPVWRGVNYACVMQENDGNRAWSRYAMNGIVLTGSKSWTDYEASMDAKFDPDNTGQNIAELIVRGRDTKLYGNFYYAAGFSGSSKLVLEKVSQGELSRLKEAAIDNVNDGIWRTLKVRVLDNTINVYLNGQLKLQYTDDLLPNLKGGIGIRTEESNVLLDNVIVTKLNDPLGGDYDNEVGGNFDKPAPAQ